MSIAAVKPIVLAEAPVSRIEGSVSRIDRRGKSLFTFEGAGLCKIGRGEVAIVSHGGNTYRGELVAIAPTRAILHISNSRSDHGVTED